MFNDLMRQVKGILGDQMEATTLSFQNMHEHGDLLVNLFKARRESFIVRRSWDLPEAEGMEYDQYDTPASRWIAVHEDGVVLAGVRLTPTLSKCGMYTYLIRDAQRGLLDEIPSNLLDFEAPVDPQIWESSRVFVREDVPAKTRSRVQLLLMNELVRAARQNGVTQVIGLVPAVWSRWIRRLGIVAEPAGPKMDIDGFPSQVALLQVAENDHVKDKSSKPQFSVVEGSAMPQPSVPRSSSLALKHQEDQFLR
jgi:N-acyl-L-homoserine lactone synthetase